MTGNYDPETNLAFWGTGNGGPTIGDQRPGDNLYVASTIALDVATGAIKGHFQYHPNDSWDWDEVSPPILVDYPAQRPHDQGADRRRAQRLSLVPRAQRRTDSFVEGKPFVYQNVFRSLDPVTGRPDVDPEHKPGTGKRADYCPASHGGKNWPPIAFSPRTRMIYMPANNNLCGSNMGVQPQYTPGRAFVGMSRQSPFISAGRRSRRRSAGVERGHRSEGVDARVPEVAELGRDAVDGGGLVFSGGTSDRKFHAFDATTRQAAVGVPDELGRRRAALVVLGRWQAVRRGRDRLGRRLARHAGDAE